MKITNIALAVLSAFLGAVEGASEGLILAKVHKRGLRVESRISDSNENQTLIPKKLRGGVHEASHTTHRKPAIVALQAKASTRLQNSKQASVVSSQEKERVRAEEKERDTRRMAKHEHSYFARLLSSLHKQVVQKELHMHAHKVNLCDGNQYQWMVGIRQSCKDSFGDDSLWDNERGEGACRQAWDECNSDFVGTCCTQPEGPQSMEAYCSRPEASDDRACAVSGPMAQVQGVMGGIRDSIGLMETRIPAEPNPTIFEVLSGDCKTLEGGRCVASSNWPEDYNDDDECDIRAPTRGVVHPKVKFVTKNWNTEGCCDKLTVGDRVYGGDSIKDGPDKEIEEPITMEWRTDFSSSASGWKVCVEDVPPAPPPPPPPLCLQDRLPSAGGPSPGGPGPSPGAQVVEQVYVPCPAPAGIPGGIGPSPGPYPGPAPAPAGKKIGPRKPTKLEMQCQKLTDLVRKAGKHIDAIKKFAEHDGIVPGSAPAAPAPAERNSRAKSLLLATLASGQFLARIAGHGNANEGTSEAKDPDLSFAVVKILKVGSQLEGLRDSSFCGKLKNGVIEEEDDDDDDDDSEEDFAGDSSDAVAGRNDDESVEVNGTAIAALLNFDQHMVGAVDGFEKGVHPHGKKWWRYRYEYTLIESYVLAVSVLLLYLVMYLLHGVSFFDKFKFYNVGLTSRLYRYAWGYFVFHAAALMVMVTVAYMIYMPWGKYNLFDYLAPWFREVIDTMFPGANVPYLGYSWLVMVLDVQFQLFVCFTMYALFIVLVTRNFARALDDWKAFSVNAATSGDASARRLPINDYHYKDFFEIMTHRVRSEPSFHQVFGDVRLRFRAVEGIDSHRQSGFNDFQLHLYFTDNFGKALVYLVEVSWRANLFICIAALCFAFLAHHFQVAFMYFLPVFIVLGVFIFACSYLVSRSLRYHDHKQPLEHLTVHAYCRSIQLVLYAVFFSFSRLILSHDIFTDYPRVYLAALVGFLVAMFLAWVVAGEIMKATILAVILPHYSQQERFKMNLQHVAYWHTTENCHECGVRQAPTHASVNREWAGTDVKSGVPQSAATSGREFSFRG